MPNAEYTVHRATSATAPESSWKEVAAFLKEPKLVDLKKTGNPPPDPLPGVTYFYRVKSVTKSPAAQSAWSAPVAGKLGAGGLRIASVSGVGSLSKVVIKLTGACPDANHAILLVEPKDGKTLRSYACFNGSSTVEYAEPALVYDIRLVAAVGGDSAR